MLTFSLVKIYLFLSTLHNTWRHFTFKKQLKKKITHYYLCFSFVYLSFACRLLEYKVRKHLT